MQFDNKNFRKFCIDLKIEQRFTSVAHPQTNGQTEVTNIILHQGIKKRLDEKAGRWVDELYNVLWAYRTTPRAAMGESSFNLTFGTEAIIPIDIGVPSRRVTCFNERLNEGGLRANLDLLEEVREESQIRSAAYKQRGGGLTLTSLLVVFVGHGKENVLKVQVSKLRLDKGFTLIETIPERLNC
ncbi:uncharacterized protein LOC143853932 [Tasmannia lanceolata]|uniref:uncharacterized protein LOC143853932 n=1 Tax=Tasmannia lanceolata TaxID=3420 RepID=UPI004063218C